MLRNVVTCLDEVVAPLANNADESWGSQARSARKKLCMEKWECAYRTMATIKSLWSSGAKERFGGVNHSGLRKIGCT